MLPKLLIATRLGLGIRDPAWFAHRLAVMSAITAPSLLAQDDQEYEWGIFVGPDCPDSAFQSLEGIVEPFMGRAFIDSNGHSSENLLRIAANRGLVQPSGHLFTGRIDDDDAWARETVRTARNRLSSWLEQGNPAAGLGLTFDKGLVWVMYDMLDVKHLQLEGDETLRRASLRPYTHPFTGISGFVCSHISDGMSAISAGHQEVPERLYENGFEINVVSTPDPMWLYCRHKQTDSTVERAAKSEKLDIDLEFLGNRFGINVSQAASYISGEQGYGYSIGKGLAPKRGELRVAIRETRRKMSDGGLSAVEVDALRERATQLESEYAQLGEDLIVGKDALAIHLDRQT